MACAPSEIYSDRLVSHRSVTGITSSRQTSPEILRASWKRGMLLSSGSSHGWSRIPLASHSLLKVGIVFRP